MRKAVLVWAVRRIAGIVMSRRGNVSGVGGDGLGGSGGCGYAPLHPARDARLDGLLTEASALLRTLSVQIDRLRDERRGPGDMRGDAVYRRRDGSDTLSRAIYF